MQGAHNPLDLSFVGGEWPQTADSNRLTVDLGDVEPRARLQQAIEVEEEIALALELEVDSIVGEDARANPLLKLVGQKYNVNREEPLRPAFADGKASPQARQPSPSEVAMGREEWQRLLQRQPAVYRRVLLRE